MCEGRKQSHLFIPTFIKKIPFKSPSLFWRYTFWFTSQEGGSPRNSLCHFSHADTLTVQRFRRLNLSVIVLWFKLFNYFKYWLSNFLLTYFLLKQICCQLCVFIRRAPFQDSVRMVMNIAGFFQSIWRLLQYAGQIFFFPIYENCSIQLIADILLHIVGHSIYTQLIPNYCAALLTLCCPWYITIPRHFKHSNFF